MKDYKIKLIAAILSLVFCFHLPLVAQEKSAASTGLHSLWKVAGKSNTVYLLGSVHLLKPENFPLAPALESAYSNSQVVVFETDLEKMEDPQLQFKLLAKGRLPEGESLKQHLSADTYASFATHAKKAGLPVEILDTMKPGFAAMMLSVVELTRLGFDPNNGIDKYFFTKAKPEGKQIVGLETVEFQMDLITGFSKEEDDLVMKSSLEDMDNMATMFGEILKAWQAGDSTALEKLLNDAVAKAPTVFKRLITDRNKNWIPKIEEFLRGDKNVIVIVGAGHLVGPEGVVELLKKKGLKVTQL